MNNELKKFYDIAKDWEDRINNNLHNQCIKWEIYPATKKVNSEWTWTGSYKVITKPYTWGVNKHLENKFKTVRYIKNYKTITDKMVKNSTFKFEPISGTCRIIAYYRRTKLIPLSVAKRHAKKLPQNLYYTPEFYKTALPIVLNYIMNYAKCPQCGKRKSMMETVYGLSCTNCDYSLYDYDNEVKEIFNTPNSFTRYEC